jgi:glutaredoxin
MITKVFCFCFALALVWCSGQTSAVEDNGIAAEMQQRPPHMYLEVRFFYTPTCQYCQDAKDALVVAEKKWGDRIVVHRFDTSEEDMSNYLKLFDYEDHYGSGEEELPKVFIGTKYIAGGKEIAQQLDRC